MISAIVAVDENWGIGFNGSLLERIPEDLKRFKELTENNIVVMGRKTQESLPNKRLPNRTNIVITNKALSEEGIIYDNLENVAWFLDFSSFYKSQYDSWQSSKKKEMKDIFIIGGGSIYYQLLGYCDRIYLTKIYKAHEVDTYFPNIDQMENEWEITSTEEPREYDGVKYQFFIYDKKKN